MKFRKKPVVIEARKWFKNGEHPEDGEEEGSIVRYFRRSNLPGENLCPECLTPFYRHGWIATLEDGHRVCPGDWIITGITGEYYPCKPHIFELTYDIVDTESI